MKDVCGCVWPSDQHQRQRVNTGSNCTSRRECYDKWRKRSFNNNDDDDDHDDITDEASNHAHKSVTSILQTIKGTELKKNYVTTIMLKRCFRHDYFILNNINMTFSPNPVFTFYCLMHRHVYLTQTLYKLKKVKI